MVLMRRTVPIVDDHAGFRVAARRLLESSAATLLALAG